MRAFVTGGTGFIGRHLVRRLVSEGWEVACLVRTPEKASLLKPLNVSLFFGDITERNTLKRIANEKFDVFFHLGALVALGPRKKLMEANVQGTENICSLAFEMQIKQLIYLSSIATIVGNGGDLFHDDLPYQATNAYGDSKIEAEKKVLSYREKGLPVAIFRPPIVYGEEETHFLNPLVFLLKYRLFPLIKGGGAKLQMVYIHNLIDALLFSVGNQECLKGTFIVADKDALTIQEISLMITKALGVKEPWKLPEGIANGLLKIPLLGPRVRKFMKHTLFSDASLGKVGFQPKYTARESFQKTVQNFIKFNQ